MQVSFKELCDVVLMLQKQGQCSEMFLNCRNGVNTSKDDNYFILTFTGQVGQAGIDEGFKTFTLQHRDPPS